MMTNAIKVRNSTVGLVKGRIDWSLIENLSCLALAHTSPMYGRIIGKNAGGMSQGQVYNRLKQTGYSLRDIRNGKSPMAKAFIKKYSVGTMSTTTLRELSRQFTPLLK